MAGVEKIRAAGQRSVSGGGGSGYGERAAYGGSGGYGGGASGGDMKAPEQMSPQELHDVLWQVLSFRDTGEFVWVTAVIVRAYGCARSHEEGFGHHW